MDLTGVRWEAVTRFGDTNYLLPRLQEMPGFDNEAFIRAAATSEDGSSVLRRRSLDHGN